MDLNRIYNDFKNIDIHKLYYDRKHQMKYVPIISICIGGVLMLSLFFLPSNNKIIIYTFLLFGIIFIIFGVTLMNKINKKISIKIKQKLHIEHEYKNTEAYFNIARRVEFIKYLDGIGIKSFEKKELLARLLYEKYNETKINSIWFVSAFIALILPIWNKIIDIELPKHMGNANDFFSYSGKLVEVSILIIVLLVYFKSILYESILYFINAKSKRYKDMYDFLQSHILKDKI